MFTAGASQSLIVMLKMSYTVSVFRACFEELQTDYLIMWFIVDFICDVIYIMDMVFRTRTGLNAH